VNQILNLLLSRVKKVLGSQFLGMYLYGSLASGDFDPKGSDIDFVVITEGGLSDERIIELESMHGEIWAGGLKWAAKLEGSYIPRDLIRRHDPDGLPCPTVNEGRFFVDRCGSDWIIQRHIIRECGVVLYGPNPKTLIDPLSPDEIQRAVKGVLDEWWFPMLDHPDWLAQRGAEYHAFAVISMCRALHALEHGRIVSKPAAAAWAHDELGAPWNSLIEKALAAQHGAQDGFLGEALDFIRFTRSGLNKMKQSG
jgi:predicted nucleotidyltransferase